VAPDIYTPQHYTLKPGQSLSGIAAMFNIDPQDLYQLNKGTLEREAKVHGYSSSNGGTLVFAGTTLQIGGKEWA
jgi:hypothetical protein